MHASMNRIYRLIWSHVHQTWVIVHERSKGKGKSANRRLLASVLLVASPAVMAGPTGGQVTAGTGTITRNDATTTINQASQNLSLNWQSFNTASGETVNFVQPSASAIAVNRISDNNATRFYGALNANGQVYLINPNGVVFGSGSQVNVGGLVASTLDVSDASLNSTTRQFSGAGTGSIVNQGTIKTANGGYVALLGNTVRNQGTIDAASGAVALGAASDVTLSFSGNSLVQLQVNQSTLNNLAENGGLIKADGGAVWLSAGARDAVLASVVNNTGIIEARSVQQTGGTIVLGAGSAGAASNSGTLDASASQAGGGAGGTVKVLGGAVKLAAGSVVDVSGDSGGGSALIGGNFLGAGAELNAHTTTVEAGTSINADAITAGHGGKVAVWSDNSTQFDGGITARGGAVSGNGGQVETSGKHLNISASAAVSTAAPSGKAGEWLLDPDDIVIGNASVWPADTNINIDTRVLTAALNNGNVTIKTTASTANCTGTTCPTGNAGNGDIIVLDTIGTGTDFANGNQSFYWINNASLTLSAYRNVVFKFTPSLSYPGFRQDTGGGIYADGLVSVVIKADNSGRGGAGVGKVIFEDSSQSPQTGISFFNSGSTTSIYYNPDSYSSPVNYTPIMTANGSLTAYMAVNVQGVVAAKTYDGTKNASLTITSQSALPSGVTLDSSSSAGEFIDKNVGNNKALTITGARFSGGGTTTTYNGQNYYINGLDNTTASINAKSIGVNVTVNNKTYDGTTTAILTGAAIAAGGVVGGDVVSLAGGSATGTFASANAGANQAITVTDYSLSGSGAGNYTLVQPTGVTASIARANLVLAGTKIYDGTTTIAGSTLTASGINGQAFSVTGAGDVSNLVSKNVQAGATLGSTSGLDLGASSNGGLAANYNALATTGSSYSVTPKVLTLTGIVANSKTYDATTTASFSTASAGYSGLAAGDTVTLAGTGVGSFANKNVGINQAVTVAGYSLGGADAGNYLVVQPSGLTATISRANLAVSGLAAANKTYDATSTATLAGTATVTAFGSDIVSVAGTGSGSFANANAGASRAVTVTGYTLAGTDAGNYNVVQPLDVTATINQANATLSGSKTYDGTTASAGSTLTAVGIGGQTFAVAGAGDASNLAGKNVQSGTVLGSTTGLSVGASSNGGLASNYVLSTVGSSYAVTPKGIVLSGITALDKVYDTTTAASLNTSNVSYSGLVAGDSVTLAGSGTGAFINKNAGVNKAVTVSGYSLGGADAGNYLAAQPAGVTATISQANLAVSGLAAANKTYDATSAATVAGTATVTAFGSDIVSVAGTGSGSFANANAGASKAVTVTGYTLAGTDAGNYNVVQPLGVTATINQANATLSGSKTYDGTTAAAGSTLTAVGIGGQTFAVAGAGDASNLAGKNVQSGTVLGSITGLSLGTSSNGGLASNYVLSTVGSSYAVTPKGLVLSGIIALDKTYDTTSTASLNTSNLGYSGLVAGDSVTLAGSGTGAFINKNAGVNKAVTVSGYSLGGADAGNYLVAQPAGVTATISQANLAVSGLAAANKTYDATSAATVAGTATVTAFGSDIVSVAGNGSGSFANANAGASRAVTVTGYTLAGTDAGNYNVVQPLGVTATINQANATLSGSKAYDGTTAAAGSTLTAVGVGGQTFAVAGAGDASNLTSKNVQNGTVLGSTTGLSLGTSSNGGLASNYVLSTVGSSYAVTPKGLVLSGITALDKTYDATTAASLNTSSVGYSGMVAGDSVTLTGSGTGAFNTKDAGSNKAVAVSGYSLAGSDAGNYVLAQPAGLSATINRASLVVGGVAAADKTYDATTGATLTGTATVTGLLGDAVAVAGNGSASFASKDAGTNKAVSVSGYSLTGSDARNYVLTQPAGLSATINRASLVVGGVAAADKTYDATTGATLTGNATVNGLLGDVVSVTGAGNGSFASKDAGTNKAVSVSGYSLTGADAANYVLTQPAGLSATINRASLVVSGITADSKAFDGTTAATVNTANVTLAGRLGADVITLAATGQFADAAAGNGKPVNLSSTYGGADLGNYNLTGQAQAFANIIAVPVVVPETPVQTPALAQPIQNAVTQLQASLLSPQASAQPQALTLSSTLVVQQTADANDSGNPGASDERTQEPARAPIINTTADFGMPAPLLRIQNGGMQLPLVATSINE